MENDDFQFASCWIPRGIQRLTSQLGCVSCKYPCKTSQILPGVRPAAGASCHAFHFAAFRLTEGAQREWMGCWGLLGLLIVRQWIIPFPTFSTRKHVKQTNMFWVIVTPKKMPKSPILKAWLILWPSVGVAMYKFMTRSIMGYSRQWMRNGTWSWVGVRI